LPGASTTSSALLVSGFLIVAAVAAPLIGKYGDAHGKQRMLLFTLAIYFVGALGAGSAPNFMALVVFRALQGAGGALFASWIWRERSTDQPLLDIAVLTKPQVLLPNLGSGLAGYVAFSMFFLVPRFVQVPRHASAEIARHLQYGFGAGPTATGLYLLPIGIGVLCAGPFGGVLGRRIGGKWPFTAGLGLLVIASALLAFVHGERHAFAVWLFLIGLGFGLSTGAAGVFVTQAVEDNQTAIANAFNSLTRLVVGGIGAQVAAAILKSQAVAGSNTPHESAFTIAFGICALLAAVGAGLALSVPAGNAGSG